MLKKMMDHLTAQVSEKKQGKLQEWMDDLGHCLRHMDEAEYGRDFLHNLMAFCGAAEGKRMPIDNRVVENTEYCLCSRLGEIMGMRRHRLQDIVRVDGRETLLPEGRWLWRGYRSYVCRCKHGVEMRLIAEKNGDEQGLDTMLSKMMEAVTG